MKIILANDAELNVKSVNRNINTVDGKVTDTVMINLAPNVTLDAAGDVVTAESVTKVVIDRGEGYSTITLEGYELQNLSEVINSDTDTTIIALAKTK